MLETVVIGGGVAGFSAAIALWERGAAVTLVELERPGAGATGASAGMLTAQYESNEPTPLFRLLAESRAGYPAFAERVERLSGHDLAVRWDGTLVANLTGAEHSEAVAAAAWQREAGFAVDVLEPSQAERLQPGVTAEAVSYLWFPEEGHLDSQALAAAMGAALAGTEIRLIAENGAAAVQSQGGAVTGVAMSDGRSLEADRIVLAAGAWSAEIGGLPREVPVRPVRGQILHFPSGVLDLRHIVGSHAGKYLVPRIDGSVLAGSTMEEVGYDQSITEEGMAAIQEGVSELVPALAAAKSMERWAGLRPISADMLPIIGLDPELEGLIYATGFGRYGISLGPLAGTIVADLALSGATEYEIEPFRPDRFRESGPM